MEIMIVVIIVGIIAAFALPNFQNSIDNSHERDGYTQLMAVQAANTIYKAQNGTYYKSTTAVSEAGPTGLNTNLNINIIPNGLTYSYTSNAGGTTFTATTTSSSPSFQIKVTEASISPSTNPCCVSGCKSKSIPAC